MIGPLCGRGRHPRIPVNRTAHDRCRICAWEARQELAEKNRQSKRAQREREQTAKNLIRRENKSTSDDTPQEHARVAQIFKLMDAIEAAPSARDRLQLQAQIDQLAGGKPK
tara:strand:- start:483 stop:815 length:333 start_codon:yes stop_codon:yes gene_type:complete